MRLEFSRQIFERKVNINFYQNPSSGGRVVLCGQTDGHNEANSRFSQFCERAEKVENWNSNIFKRLPKFSLREWKRSEMKVVEEYCWAMTQTAGRSCCSQSGSSLSFIWSALYRLYVYSWPYVYLFAICGKFDFPVRNYCVNQGVSVCVFASLLNMRKGLLHVCKITEVRVGL